MWRSSIVGIFLVPIAITSSDRVGGQNDRVSGGRARRGRSMCEAARTQIAKLEPYIRKVARQANRDIIHEFFDGAEPFGFAPVHHVFPEQDVPTLIVNMTLPETLRKQMEDDATRVMRVEQYLYKSAGTTVTGYNPFTLQFENSVLFNPACAEFMELNRDVVKQNFPEAVGCQCNLFVVEPGKQLRAYGLHHATSIGYEYHRFYDRGWFMPKFHKSFHTAVTPTDFDSSPFTMFDGHTPELMNLDHMLQFLRRRGEPHGGLTEEERFLAHVAFTVFHQDLSYPPVKNHYKRSFMDYLTARYWWAKSCHGDGDWGGHGTWWELEPGQALHFNNWRAHSDNGFGNAAKQRVTMDLRCYSKHVVPFPFRNDGEFITVAEPDILLLEDTAKACMLRLFNISSIADFYRIVFGRDVGRRPLSSAVGSIFLNLINPGRFSLLHPDNLEGMRRYNAIVRRAYDSDSLNFDAFSACYEEHRTLFDANVNLTPPGMWTVAWVLAMQLMFGLRLMFSDAAIVVMVAVSVLVLAAKIVLCRAACRWCRRRWRLRGGGRKKSRKKE